MGSSQRSAWLSAASPGNDTYSGEFARWEACRAETPEDEEVLYPPLPLSAEELMKLAISADRVERRRANKVQEDK